MKFENLFKIGLDRDLPELLDALPGKQIELGASYLKHHPDAAYGLGLPDWSWPSDSIPEADGSVSVVHAYHFMEHLTGEDAIALLREVQRVLMVGGIFQFCIPWAKAEIAYQDLTHKSFWTESSFRMLMNNPYYDPTANGTEWKLKQHYLVIGGIVERNLCIMGQLVKEG